MKRYLAIALCAVSFAGLAKTVFPDDFHQEIELLAQFVDKKITSKQYDEKLSECSGTGNRWCASTLGDRLFELKKYSEAYPYLIKSQGILKGFLNINAAPSEFQLGLMFGEGLGVLQNTDKAIFHFKICSSVGESACANNIAAIYHNRARQSNDYRVQLSNLIKAYAWEQVARTLGYKETFNTNGTKENVSVTLDRYMEALGKFNRLTEANKLASHICSTIPKCIQ